MLFPAFLTGASFVIFFLSAAFFDAGRPDFYYLADAFLHGRTWLTHALGPWDVSVVDGRVYVPFAPFPALLLTPLVALVGPQAAATRADLIDAALAAVDVLLVWILAGRLGVRRGRDRFWLAWLFGFSTQIWWVTMRGGVWHLAHLVAAALTILALIETTGRRRPLVLGLLAGAAFLTRAPLAFAVPLFGWVLIQGSAQSGSVGRLLRFDRWPWRRLAVYALGIVPFVAFFLWYDAVRFGSPLDSGYGSAALPEWLAALRAQGLFGTVHLAMNLDYLFLKLPALVPEPPFIRPDGLGMSILLTSPGLLLAVRADWRRPLVIALALTAIVVLIPSLLYYGGGWFQFGYRYALDSIPFVIALCALAAKRYGVGPLWRLLIVVGTLVGLAGVWWNYRL